MTNTEKRELASLCKRGLSFKDIREIVSCSDATIKRYIRALGEKKK